MNDDLEGARVDPPAAGDYLTRDEMQQLRDELTMGDTWKARDLAPDDSRRSGMLGLWIVAKRIGLAPRSPDDDTAAMFAFLDRMKVDDVNAVYNVDAEAARGPKSPDGPPSPDSPTTGE